MINITRRYMLAALGYMGAFGTALAAAGCRGGGAPSQKAQPQQAQSQQTLAPWTSQRFSHGIASGDPAPGRMIIWTRVSPQTVNETAQIASSITVTWQVSLDPLFASILLTGQVQTDGSRDYTVKVDIDALKPGQVYYYRFADPEGEYSDIGQFKSLPVGAVSQLDFAIISCANYQAGYFNVYEEIAKTAQSLDAIIHLGDYFYEYGVEDWGGAVSGGARNHLPPHEIVSLSDYRQRHAQYRTDPSLQKMTLNAALIALWDDHEIANDSYSAGAVNHQPESEGEWGARRDAAMKAYYEWMPVREPDNGRPAYARYAAYEFGDLLTLVTAETRLTERVEPINMDDYTADFKTAQDVSEFKENVLHAPDRHVLGEAQMSFITDQFARSKHAGKPWRILANQVVMGRIATPDLTPHVDEASISALEADWPNVRDFVQKSKYGLPVYTDSWDGYPWAREQFYDRLAQAGVNDIVVVTGDAHEFWLNDLTTEQGVKMGVELGTSSVSSPTLEDYFGEATEDYALLMTQSNPDVRYYNAMRRGYIHLTLGRDGARAQMIQVDQVESLNYTASRAARFDIKRSGESLKSSGARGLSLKQRLLFMGLG